MPIRTGRNFLFWSICWFLAAGCGVTPDQGTGSRRPDVIFPTDQSEYAAIDRHARSAPPAAEASLECLAGYLTGPARNDRERARAIYTWLAANIAYDVGTSPFSGRSGTDVVESTLRTRKAVCEGYAELFYELGERMGLTMKRIRGYSKGHTYYKGKRFDSFNHEWIGVRLDGGWRLIDPTWGAGMVKDGRVIKKFDPTYFLTPPDYFIFEHLPGGPQWQLLGETLDLKEFEALAYPGPSGLRTFYRLGIPGRDLMREARQRGFTAFPKAHDYPGKRTEVRLAPLNGRLESGEAYAFSVESPTISGAAVLNNGTWHDLTENGSGRFEGRVRAEPGVLKLSVLFEENSTRYWPLLVYAVD